MYLSYPINCISTGDEINFKGLSVILFRITVHIHIWTKPHHTIWLNSHVHVKCSHTLQWNHSVLTVCMKALHFTCVNECFACVCRSTCRLCVCEFSILCEWIWFHMKGSPWCSPLDSHTLSTTLFELIKESYKCYSTDTLYLIKWNHLSHFFMTL